MIYRVEERKRYSVISNDVIEDSRLNWQAKGLLCFLLSKPDNWTVNREHLIKQTADGETKVKRALSDLTEAGYLVKTKHRRGDGTFYYETSVHESPVQTAVSFTTSGESTGGKPPSIVSTERTSTQETSTESIHTYSSDRNGVSIVCESATAEMGTAAQHGENFTSLTERSQDFLKGVQCEHETGTRNYTDSELERIASAFRSVSPDTNLPRWFEWFRERNGFYPYAHVVQPALEAWDRTQPGWGPEAWDHEGAFVGDEW